LRNLYVEKSDAMVSSFRLESRRILTIVYIGVFLLFRMIYVLPKNEFIYSVKRENNDKVALFVLRLCWSFVALTLTKPSRSEYVVEHVLDVGFLISAWLEMTLSS
jgi:hypothetical protein